MRDYSYRVMLDREGHVASQYAGAEGKVLWLTLDRGNLVQQREFTDPAQLKAALEAATQK